MLNARLWRGAWLAALAGSLAWLSPDAAEACGCQATRVAIATGTTHPSNGSLLVSVEPGCDQWDFADLVATVDGIPAELVVPPQDVRQVVSVELEPAPIPGQRIEIRRRSLPLEPPVTLLVDVADDQRPDAPAVAVEASIGEYDSDGCRAAPIARVLVTLSELPVDDSATKYEITVEVDGTVIADAAVIQPEFLRYYELDANPLDGAEGVCAYVRAIDAAGNASTISRACVDGVDDQLPPAADDDGNGDSDSDEGGDDDLDDEPTDAEPEPETAADSTADTDPGGGASCTCTVAGRASWWLLPLLGIAARRRRARATVARSSRTQPMNEA
ncbi:MAG: hypothetical protein AAF721_28875 [Myxococcota bacterium]